MRRNNPIWRVGDSTESSGAWTRPGDLQPSWIERINPYRNIPDPPQRNPNPYEGGPNPYEGGEYLDLPPDVLPFRQKKPPGRVNPAPGADVIPAAAPQKPEVSPPPSPIGTGKRRFTDD